jgi:hypothetical protein
MAGCRWWQRGSQVVKGNEGFVRTGRFVIETDKKSRRPDQEAPLAVTSGKLMLPVH